MVKITIELSGKVASGKSTAAILMIEALKQRFNILEKVHNEYDIEREIYTVEIELQP